MTEQDRQLWKLIRTAMAGAEWNSASDNLIVLPHAEFDLLYGEVNAKCHESVTEVRLCVTCKGNGTLIIAGGVETCGACRGRGEYAVAFVGLETDAQVLRHADTVESWNADRRTTERRLANTGRWSANEQPWTAEQILKREG